MFGFVFAFLGYEHERFSRILTTFAPIKGCKNENTSS